MPGYEAVLFDFDGVLVDSEPVHHACWAEVVRPFGVDLDWTSYSRDCIGVADRAMIETLCAKRDPPVPFDLLWAEYPRKKQLFRARMCSADAVSREVRDLLQVLGSYRLAVVTSSGRSEVEPILAAAGILQLLETVVYGEDVQRLKPAPDPYLLAAARLGVKRALVVEDSAAGVASGRAAGFEVFVVDTAARMPERLRAHLKI